MRIHFRSALALAAIIMALQYSPQRRTRSRSSDNAVDLLPGSGVGRPGALAIGLPYQYTAITQAFA